MADGASKNRHLARAIYSYRVIVFLSHQLLQRIFVDSFILSITVRKSGCMATTLWPSSIASVLTHTCLPPILTQASTMTVLCKVFCCSSDTKLLFWSGLFSNTSTTTNSAIVPSSASFSLQPLRKHLPLQRWLRKHSSSWACHPLQRHQSAVSFVSSVANTPLYISH